MRCADVEARLMRYVDGRLEPREARRLDAHLEVCPRCRRSYADEIELCAVFHAEAERKPAEDLAQAVRTEPEARPAGRRRAANERLALRPLGLSVLCLALGALCAAGWLWRESTGATASADAVGQLSARLLGWAGAWWQGLHALAVGALGGATEGVSAALVRLWAQWSAVSGDEIGPAAWLTAAAAVACAVLIGGWRRRFVQE